jgi:peptidoglycan biosynthesis protein MviN/MurJ (putative lipid II flippase)
MKNIILILGLLFSVSVFSQDTTKYVTNTNAEKLVDKYLDQATSAITALAVSLKQPAEHVYEVLVKQQIVKGVMVLSILVLSLFMIILSYAFSRKSDFNKGNFAAVSTIACGVAGCIMFLYSMVCMDMLITGLFNPEYSAIKEIVSFFK